MKLKKLFTSAVIAASAAMMVNAAPFSNYRVFLNPGHGGHDSDDRQIFLPLGVADFWESEGNLTRGLYMRDLLALYGATVGITRTHNTSADDLDLTYIATLSNNYGGWFISPHTNGGNASANYTSAFYKGSNSTNAVAGSKDMGQAMVNQHHAVELTNTTFSTPRSLADYDFWGWHYGILRTNNRPGILVESWFHDYRPEALRLKSFHYNRMLGWQLIRGFLTSPVGGSGMKGAIAGDCRDLSQSCGYTNYATRGRDSYLALNGVKVTLRNSSGAVVKVGSWNAKSNDDASLYPSTQTNPMYTDNNCNGVFFFDELTAGTYTVEVQKDGYANQIKTVTVTNDNITKCCFDMKQGTSTGITPSISIWEASAYAGESASKSVTVSAAGLSANISITVSGTNANLFTVSPASLGTSGGSFTVTYRPTSAGSHSAVVTLKSGTHSETIAVTGTAKNRPISFTQVWNYSETSGQSASWATFAQMRNMDYGAGKLYVVNPGNAVNIINAQTGAKMGELSMNGVSGGALSLIDVKYIDGKIVGCNIATNASGQNTFKIYCWDNDLAQPRVILSTTNIGGKARIGDCMNLRGNLTNGSFSFAAGGATEANSVLTYSITNGVVSTTPTSVNITDDTGSEGIILGLSPRIVPEQGGQFWGIGQNYLPTLFQENGRARATLNQEVLTTNRGNCFTAFTYKGTSYGLATDYKSETEAGNNLMGGKAVLFDATNGWAKAEKIGVYPSAGLGSTRNTSFSTSICTHVDGDKGVEMWVLVHNQGIAYFKCGSPSAITPTIDGDPDAPALSVTPASISLEVTEGKTAPAAFDVTGANLSGNISVALSGANASMFRLFKTSMTAEGGRNYVTYAPKATGSHSATITISAAGASNVTISVTGKCNKLIDPEKFVFEQKMKSTDVSGVNDGRFSTAYGDCAYIADKTAGVIYRYDANGNKSTYATVSGLGTAITSDDAGNIVVNKGLGGVGSCYNWVIIEPNGTQHTLTLTMPDGVKAARLDASGRIVGNVMSSAGAYWCLTPSANEKAAIFKIANGAQVSATAVEHGMGEKHISNGTTSIAQPRYSTIADIESHGVSAFVYRNRGNANVTIKALSRTTIDGFDVFTLGDKTYLVEPTGTTGKYSDGFTIHELGSDEVVAEKSESITPSSSALFQSITARVSDDGTYAMIYQNVSGNLVNAYRFGMPATEVEPIVASPSTAMPVESVYYNLRGQRLASPAAGQVMIRVDRMSDGSVRSSKVVVR